MARSDKGDFGLGGTEAAETLALAFETGMFELDSVGGSLTLIALSSCTDQLGSSLGEGKTCLARRSVVPFHEIVDRHEGSRWRMGMSNLVKRHVIDGCLADLFSSPIVATVRLAGHAR